MRIIFFTDLHLGDNHGWREGWRMALREIRAFTPDVLICGGDAGIDDSVGDTQCWLETLQDEVEKPIYFCAGNHEIDTGYYHAGRPPGSLYRTWDVGGAHFIILDCIHTTPPAANLPHKWYGAISDTQFDWLCRDLAQVPHETPLILTTHMPLKSTFPLRHDTPQDSTFPFNVVREEDRLFQLLQPYKNAVCLSGHLHENERSYSGNVQLLTTGAIAGNWWRQGGDSPNFDGAPQGFRILDIAPDGSIVTFYHALDPQQRREAARFQGKEGAWFLNVFDGSARTRVLLNGRELTFVDPTSAPGEKRPAHLWVLPHDLEESRAEAIIYFEDGRTVRATV
jgi:3',5'-cyclic AMP phosphodiesterase CpdA